MQGTSPDLPPFFVDSKKARARTEGLQYPLKDLVAPAIGTSSQSENDAGAQPMPFFLIQCDLWVLLGEKLDVSWRGES